MRLFKYLFALAAMLSVGSCSEANMDIIYDHPFIYIEDRFGSDSSEENCMAVLTSVYTVYLSSKTFKQDVNVKFEVVAGDGLKAGVDYVILTNPAIPLLFPSGNYQRDIRIQWLSNEIDKTNDNTLTIVLTEVDADITLGYPGPDKKFKQHTITKVLID